MTAAPATTHPESARLRHLAARLSAQGWRLYARTGPRGTYYDGFGPGGQRIMSAQNPDPKAALAQALTHAAGQAYVPVVAPPTLDSDLPKDVLGG